MTTPAVHVAAPAKINLHLRVGPPTADGFHPLLSWMVTVGLFDNLEFVPDSQPGVRLTCDDPAIPTDASNLVVQAARALLEGNSAHANTGLSIALKKRIPSGAGLGGGSADGAFTLLALNRLLDLNWSADRLAAFASRFGSDLAFFCHGPSGVCTGRGEIVRPISPPKPRWAVLILPGIHMPTPAVYRRFDEINLGHPASLADAPDWHHWATLDAKYLLPRLVNDLEAPAFSLSPPLADLHARATDVLARIVRMSGSGSSLFTLYDEQSEAEIAAGRIRHLLGVRTEVVEVCPTLREMDTTGLRKIEIGE